MTFDPETKKKIIDYITNNEEIPAYFKDILFPIQSEPKEIELKYGAKERGEDILSNTFALPLQSIMKFGNVKDNEWHLLCDEISQFTTKQVVKYSLTY